MTPIWPRRRLLAAAAGLAAAALLPGCVEDRKAAASRSARGPAPELALIDPNGQAVRLDQYRGQVVLLNFWLAECGPCLAELPDFDAYHRANKDRGFTILAVNMGQNQGVIANVARRLDLSFPLLADPLTITTARYAVLAAPTSFIIDQSGHLAERINGPLNRRDLEDKAGRLL